MFPITHLKKSIICNLLLHDEILKVLTTENKETVITAAW